MDGNSYENNTVNARNPIARYAHRARLRRSVALAGRLLRGGPLLDYGCGTGAFVSAMRKQGKRAVGYEPYMEAKTAGAAHMFCDFTDAAKHAPFDLMTVFEVVEHLTEPELDELLCWSRAVLAPQGRILFSAPIEIGPALFLKQMNRMLIRPYRREYRLPELLRAGIFGIPGARAQNVKISHKGFDFRLVIDYLRWAKYKVTILDYSPLPIPSWYGNSQIFFMAETTAKTKLNHPRP